VLHPVQYFSQRKTIIITDGTRIPITPIIIALQTPDILKDILKVIKKPGAVFGSQTYPYSGLNTQSP